MKAVRLMRGVAEQQSRGGAEQTVTRALQVGVDRRSSLAFKGAGTETDWSE